MQTKKTTILMPRRLHESLRRAAKRRRASVGQLIREACEAHYGGPSIEDKLALLERVVAFQEPVSSAEEMHDEYSRGKYPTSS
jgi:hypothetical protein